MPSSTIQPKVLIVEDRPPILLARQSRFQDFGFETVGAESYEQALSKFKTTPGISLIATDINLDPGDDLNVDGFKLAEDLKAMVPLLPIVAISGVVSESSFERSAKMGLFADHFLKASGYDKLEKKIPEWRNLAIEFSLQKVSLYEAELARLRQSYGVTGDDLRRIREINPVLAEMLSTADSRSHPEESIERLGQEIALSAAIMEELRLLICTSDKKYSGVRSAGKKFGASALIAISSFIAGRFGLGMAVASSAVAASTLVVLKVGVESFCRVVGTHRRVGQGNDERKDK
jgi:CheY-like chemotaxis protein